MNPLTLSVIARIYDLRSALWILQGGEHLTLPTGMDAAAEAVLAAWEDYKSRVKPPRAAVARRAYIHAQTIAHHLRALVDNLAAARKGANQEPA